jgi:Zn-dependent peptidase ImmA (M78 family)
MRAPKLSYEDIRRRADDFLLTHHPSHVLPIPIEDIIDLQLRVNIVPVPSLRQAFDIDAFTSSDCTEITVDEAIYNKQPHRYRFSLAHEVGHILLHAAIYRLANFRSVDE